MMITLKSFDNKVNIFEKIRPRPSSNVLRKNLSTNQKSLKNLQVLRTFQKQDQFKS